MGYVGLRQWAGLDQQLRRHADRLRYWLPGSSRGPGSPGQSGPPVVVAPSDAGIASGRSTRTAFPLLHAASPARCLPSGFGAAPPLVPTLTFFPSRSALGEGRVGAEPAAPDGGMRVGGATMSRRLIALLILTVSILTACGRASATHPAAAGYLIFLEAGYSSGGETVKVLDSGTGTVVRELPIGTAASDWSRYYVVTHLTGSAQLKAINPATGRTIAQTAIPAGYTLPNIASQGPTAGLSPNGQWLALTSQGRAAGGAITTTLLG